MIVLCSIAALYDARGFCSRKEVYASADVPGRSEISAQTRGFSVEPGAGGFCQFRAGLPASIAPGLRL